MLTEDKVTEIFCMADDFWKFFDAMTLMPKGKIIYLKHLWLYTEGEALGSTSPFTFSKTAFRTLMGNRIKIIKWLGRHREALQGRHSCIALGASPGLIVNQHILSPKGAALLCPRQMLAPKVPLLRSSDLFYLYVPRVSYRALPSLHPGLCRGVVPKGTRKAEV